MTIVCLGDSLTAGYGLDQSQAYPALLQEKIDALEWRFRVINAGISGDTSAAALSRIDWILKRKVDVLILAVGANDALRGLPLQETKKNLELAKQWNTSSLCRRWNLIMVKMPSVNAC